MAKKRSILDPNYFDADPQDQRYVRPNAATRAALDRPLDISVTRRLERQGRGKPRKLAVKPSVGDYAQTAAEVLQGLRLDRLPQTGMRAGQQIGPAIGSGLSALYDYVSRTSPGEMASSIAGAPAAFGRRVREDPGVLLEMLPGAGTVQGIEEGAQRLAEGDPEAMRNAAALAVFAGAMDLIPGGGKGAGLAVKGAKGLAEGAAREAADLAVPKAPRAIQRFAVARDGPPEAPRPLAHVRTALPEVAPTLPASVTGSFDASQNVPVTYKGLQPWELTSNQVADMGDALGVPNLGPLNAPQTFPYEGGGGERFAIPGGLEGQFTYEDMASMKGSGINAAQIDPELHRAIQRKIMRSMDDPQGLSDAKVLSGLTFGYTSPNNPLTPNQLATSRLRMASQEDLDRIINSRPWSLTDPVNADQRGAFSDALANRYGLGAAAKGGLGVRGSVDYSGYTDMLDLFRRDPAFFHRGEGETWPGFVERVASQVPGLSNKTGSFGVAWQPEAGVSAIDRHMASRYMDTILADPAKRDAFEARALNLASMRAAKEGKPPPKSFDELNHGFIQELLLAEVGNSPTPKFRLSTGEINPAVPEHLAGTNWISEPQKAELMGQTYKDVVNANEAAMAGSGLHLFGNQWNIWDRIRQRLEPHENMFPGLENIPRMNVDQMRVVDTQHALSGHKNYSKDAQSRLQPTKPVDPKRLRYFAAGGLAVKAVGNFAVR